MSSTARMLVWIEPAGLEKLFYEVGVELPAGSRQPAPVTEARIAKLLELAPMYGLQIRPPA